jgi:hypothetical protein
MKTLVKTITMLITYLKIENKKFCLTLLIINNPYHNLISKKIKVYIIIIIINNFQFN